MSIPRIVIAGLAGDVGKSLVSMGIIAALRARGMVVAPFKKGPDFIDSAWLGAAADLPGRNLDTFMMPGDKILHSVARAGAASDIIVVEGNRGLFDGFDAQGTHSTARLAKLMRAPVVLVIDATKVTRTIAAMVAGCRTLDPELTLAGVVLNRLGTSRQEKIIRTAVVMETGIPVLGAIPRYADQPLPSRHLGLVTQVEHPRAREVLERAAAMATRHIDLDALVEVANRARDLPTPSPDLEEQTDTKREVRIGVLRDRAFSFYYPENLSALEAAGAELLPISPITDEELPEIDALYAGGGFPELYAEELSANLGFRKALQERVEDGLPVWAECGGLVYFAKALLWEDRTHDMVGVLPVTIQQEKRPQGHGYVQAEVDGPNPFLAEGTAVSGHEFHYSRVVDSDLVSPTVFRLARGTGIGGGRDGLSTGGVVATYTHLHALGTPEWATGLVAAAAGDRR